MYVARQTNPGLRPRVSTHSTSERIPGHRRRTRRDTRLGTRSCDRGGTSDIMGLEERACRHRGHEKGRACAASSHLRSLLLLPSILAHLHRNHVCCYPYPSYPLCSPCRASGSCLGMSTSFATCTVSSLTPRCLRSGHEHMRPSLIPRNPRTHRSPTTSPSPVEVATPPSS